MLFQAAGDIIVAGVTAADVVEITRAEVSRAFDDLGLAARAVAEERVRALEDKIFERFAESPELMGAFADPDFQYSLRDAGRATASNEDEHTEKLLVDLLANRAEAGNTARVRLATSHAIRAADKLSLEALNGLTALWTISTLGASNKNLVQEQAASARSVARAVLALPLPPDNSWLQETDALNLTRSSSGGLVTRKPYRELLQDRVAPHLVHGIPQDRYRELLEPQEALDLANKVAKHQLKPEFLVLLAATREEFLQDLGEGFAVSQGLEQLITMNGFGARDPEAVKSWDDVLFAQPDVPTVAAWWDATPFVDVTMVGNVIGFVNARRHINFSGIASVSELLTGAG